MMQMSLSCSPQNNIRKLLDKFKTIYRVVLPIYWAFLTYALLRPSRERKEEFWFYFENIDKVGHFLSFVVLGFLYNVVFSKQKFYVFLGIIIIYAGLTELLQEMMKMGRSMEFADFLADILGGILGYWLYKKILIRVNGKY